VEPIELLQSILPEVERFQRVTSKIEILVLRALTEYALGEKDGAVQTLLSAIAFSPLGRNTPAWHIDLIL